MAWTDGSYHVVSADWDVEIEEREEQLYEQDGKTAVTKQQEDGPAKDKKTRVKLKRYYYRKCLNVVMSQKVAGSVNQVPSGFGGRIAELKSSMSWDGISGTSGMKFICTKESAREIDNVTGTWTLTRSWTGYSKWNKVPTSWGLDQNTEEVDDGEEDSDGDSGS